MRNIQFSNSAETIKAHTGYKIKSAFDDSNTVIVSDI